MQLKKKGSNFFPQMHLKLETVLKKIRLAQKLVSSIANPQLLAFYQETEYDLDIAWTTL